MFSNLIWYMPRRLGKTVSFHKEPPLQGHVLLYKVPGHRLQCPRNLMVHVPKLEFQRMYHKVPETLISGTL